MISIFMVFSGCKKDNASTDSGNNSGGGSTTTYAVGDYYNVDGVKGIVYRISDGGKHGMIVSLDETVGYWSTEHVITGASDQYNGRANTDLIISNYDLDNYPIFKWCKNKNTGNITGWYIPSKSELTDVIRVKDIVNEGLINNNGVIIKDLEKDAYWSSIEKDENCAWLYRVAYTNQPWGWEEKDFHHYATIAYARAIHSF